jgi:hypothetical protein
VGVFQNDRGRFGGRNDDAGAIEREDHDAAHDTLSATGGLVKRVIQKRDESESGL